MLQLKHDPRIRGTEWRDLMKLSRRQKAWELPLSLPWLEALITPGEANLSAEAALFLKLCLAFRSLHLRESAFAFLARNPRCVWFGEGRA